MWLRSLKSNGWATKSNAPWRATSAAAVTVPRAEVTDHLGSRRHGADRPERVRPGHAGQVQVQEHDCDGALGELVDALLARGDGENLIAKGREHPTEESLDAGVLMNY